MKIVRIEDITTLPEFKAMTPEELVEAYRLSKEAFTADDLQKFTEIEEGVDMGELLEKMKRTQKEGDDRGS